MKHREQYIFDVLYQRLQNRIGVAAIMGNLMAESSLNPKCANIARRSEITDDMYTRGADEGTIDFIHDKVAYGLAQWRYHSRKQGLLLMAQSMKKSVGDIDVQLQYLLQEIKTYKTVYEAVTTGKDIKEVSDIVLTRYEKPANQSDKAKELRVSYARNYYDAQIDPEAIRVTPEMRIRTAELLKRWLEQAKDWPVT